MYIYCIIFILFAVLAVEYELKTISHINFILAVLALSLSLFIGLRGVSVSRDYGPYLESFKVIMHNGGNDGSGILPLFEPGFIFIVVVCHKLFDSNPAIAVMLVFAVLSISMKFFAFKKLSFNPFLVLLLYYCHFFFIEEMTQIRNGMACSLFFFAIYYHLNDQKVKSAIFILLAMLFHNSAVLYLLLLFFKKDSFNIYLYGGLFVSAILLGLIKIPILSFVLPNVDLNLISNKLTTYADYAEKGYYEQVRFFNVLNTCNVLMTGYILFYCIRYKIRDTYLLMFLKCNIVSIFIYGLLIDIPSIATRFTELFGAVFPFFLRMD